MKRPHVAFFSCPYAAAVNPTLSIVNTLVRRAYRATYVASDTFASRICELGAEFVRCPSFTRSLDQQTTSSQIRENPSVQLAVGTLAGVTSFYEKDLPDLIIYDFLCIAGRILAERWKIPAIQTSPALALDEESINLQVTNSGFRQEVFADIEVANRFLNLHGVEGSFGFHREALNIYFYPRVFQLEGNSIDRNCFYAARCAAERPGNFKWKPRNFENRPLILVSSSTFYVQGPDYFKMCVNALSGLGWHVVLAIGDDSEPGDFRYMSPNFEIVQNIPQLQILPHADLLIFFGGMTTTMEAMYHGVPLLMISHGYPEAELFSENVIRLGLGKHLKKDEITAENIRNSVLKISNDLALLNRVKAMQRLVQREPGAEETVNRIAEYLESAPTR